MLTDYERYQLEWMIEHGHSLKEFVQGLDLVDRTASTALRMFMPSGKTTTVSAARSFLTNASSKRRTYPKS